MSLNDLDFDSSAHFFSKKEKFPWFSEPKTQETYSFNELDQIIVNKVLKVPLPLEHRIDLDYLNVPGSVSLIRNKSGNNVRNSKESSINLKGRT